MRIVEYAVSLDLVSPAATDQSQRPGALGGTKWGQEGGPEARMRRRRAPHQWRGRSTGQQGTRSTTCSATSGPRFEFVIIAIACRGHGQTVGGYCFSTAFDLFYTCVIDL